MSDDSIRVITETNVVRVTEEPIIVRVSAVGARGPVGPPGSVQSVNGDAGPFVVLDATDVGADPVGTASAEVAAFAATLAPVATSGDYADLIGVPTNVSAFANDAGYVDALGAAALEALAQAGMAHVTGWSVGLVVIGAPGDPTSWGAWGQTSSWAPAVFEALSVALQPAGIIVYNEDGVPVTFDSLGMWWRATVRDRQTPHTNAQWAQAHLLLQGVEPWTGEDL